MDSEEEEPLPVPNVDSSLLLEDNLVTTATTSDAHHQNTQSQQCELESFPDWDESGPPKEGDGKGVVDSEVAPQAAVIDEEGSKDLVVVGEEKHEMLDAGDELKVSSPVDGNKEAEGVADREESLVADEEKPHVVGDMAVDGVMEEMEKADLSDERGIAKGMEVAVAELPVAELAEEAGNFEEQKVVDDVQDPIEMPEEEEVADMAEERGTAEVDEVDDVRDHSVVMEEKGVADLMKKTGIMEEREVVDVAVNGEVLVNKQVYSELEQTGILEEIRVGYMAEKTDLLEEKPVVDVAERTGIAEETWVTDMVERRELPEDKMEVNFADQNAILEETGVIDMVEKSEILDGKLVANMSEQTENLEVNAEVTETGNVVEDVEKAEETETEMGDAAAGMEAAEDAEMLDMTEEVEMNAAEEMEDTEEIEDVRKASGGKQKQGKNLKSKVLARAPSRKKVEEDVCFICFDGGDLVLCDRRGCPKAYHTACVGRDEAFFRAKGKWNCGLIYMTEKLAGVGFREGTGSSISSFARHTI